MTVGTLADLRSRPYEAYASPHAQAVAETRRLLLFTGVTSVPCCRLQPDGFDAEDIDVSPKQVAWTVRAEKPLQVAWCRRWPNLACRRRPSPPTSPPHTLIRPCQDPVFHHSADAPERIGQLSNLAA